MGSLKHTLDPVKDKQNDPCPPFIICICLGPTFQSTKSRFCSAASSIIKYQISFIPEKTGLPWRIKRWSNQMESQLWMLLCMELENMPPFEFPNPGGDRITWDEANTQNDTYFPILQNIYYRQIEIYDVNLSRKYWRRHGNRKHLVFSFIYNLIVHFLIWKRGIFMAYHWAVCSTHEVKKPCRSLSI